MDKEEQPIDLRRYVGIFISYWWLILILPLVGGLVQYILNYDQEILYEASSTLLVQHRNPGATPGVSDFGVSSQLAVTYQRLLTATPFLTKVSQNNEEPLSLDGISAHSERNPPILEIRAIDKDAEIAARTVDIVAREFIDYVIEQRLAEIARVQAAAATQGLGTQNLVAAQLQLVDSLILLEPVSSATQIPNKLPQQIMLGVILGLMLGLGGSLVLASLRDTVRNPEDLPVRFGTVALGSLFKWSDDDADPSELVIHKLPTSGFSESLRQIRTNIQFATANRPGKIYLVTSPGPSDGKTTTICNLGVAFAQTGKRVIMIDGDLRRPSMHRMFSPLGRDPGLSNYLGDQTTEFSDVLSTSHVPNVSIVPGGPIPPNPAELLGSPRMSNILEIARENADIVLVDSPPTLILADASILASQVDGAIVVVDGFGTRSSALQATLANLRNSSVDIVGVIINKLKRPRFGNYGYGYQYHYQYYSYRYYGATDSDGQNETSSIPVYKRLFNRIPLIRSGRK